MATRLLMSASAIFQGLLGLAFTFVPQELLIRYGVTPEGIAALVLQVAGAMYLGFAMLNWMARANVIGGIYSRPVAVGNFLHFAVGASVYLRAMLGGGLPIDLMAIGAVYVVFAALFGWVVFGNPIKPAQS